MEDAFDQGLSHLASADTAELVRHWMISVNFNGSKSDANAALSRSPASEG